MLTTEAGHLLGLWFIATLSRNLVVPSDITESQQLQLDHFPMCLPIPVDVSCSQFWPHIITQSNSWSEDCITHGVFQEA